MSAKTELTKRLYPFLGIVIALAACLLVAGLSMADAISDDITDAVVIAAGFLGIIFIVKMLDEL